MDVATLSASIAAAVGPLLMKGGEELAKSAAGDLFAFVKRHVLPTRSSAASGGSEVATLSTDELEMRLRQILEAQPHLVSEAQTLIQSRQSGGIHANFHGQVGQVVQAATIGALTLNNGGKNL
jgi:hypothetical protein